jgi:hypothetical protein
MARSEFAVANVAPGNLALRSLVLSWGSIIHPDKSLALCGIGIFLEILFPAGGRVLEFMWVLPEVRGSSMSISAIGGVSGLGGGITSSALSGVSAKLSSAGSSSASPGDMLSLSVGAQLFLMAQQTGVGAANQMLASLASAGQSSGQSLAAQRYAQVAALR